MNLDNNTKEELIEIAKDLGINIDARFSETKLREIIYAEKKAESKALSNADIDAQRKVKLLIHKTDGDTGSIDVPVSVNGKTWLIKRGVEVDVPLFVVEVLKNAVKEIYVQDDVNRGIVMREVPAYPFSVTG